MYADKNNYKNIIQKNPEREGLSVCYICGKPHDTEGELCQSCVKIICSSLKPLRVISEAAS